MALDLSKELPSLLSSLLSSPELLGKLLSSLGGGSGTSESNGDVIEVAAEEGEATPTGGEETEPTALPAASDAIAVSAESRGKRREGLLRALRPYLSPSRCERLDALVRVSSMLDSIKGKF